MDPVSGHLDLVHPDKGAGTDQADIFFTKSTDYGVNWDEPIPINDDGTSKDQWSPAIAVRANGTQLFVGYYDRRSDPNNHYYHTSGRIADISGSTVTWRPSFRVSALDFNDWSFASNPGAEGDYDTATADGNYFYYAWGDNRGLFIHLGSASDDNQPDVRFSKITP